jgi:hypothetical protein
VLSFRRVTATIASASALNAAHPPIAGHEVAVKFNSFFVPKSGG